MYDSVQSYFISRASETQEVTWWAESMIRTQHFLCTHQICNLIFFPLSSTVLILKSTPSTQRDKREEKKCQSYCNFKLYGASKIQNHWNYSYLMKHIWMEYICCLNIPMHMTTNYQNTDHVLWACMTSSSVTEQKLEMGHVVAAAVWTCVWLFWDIGLVSMQLICCEGLSPCRISFYMFAGPDINPPFMHCIKITDFVSKGFKILMLVF